jgi:protein FRG1
VFLTRSKFDLHEAFENVLGQFELEQPHLHLQGAAIFALSACSALIMPVKPLSFKGDKKPSKKRKHRTEDEPSFQSNTTTDEVSTEDSEWTTPDNPSDLTGPVLMILPTSPPTALASDAHGSIFASPLENLIDGVPETSEPHDVRQVWVASSVPGTGSTGEGTREIGFKSSHGGYLSCDSIGVLGAKREARGMEEGFVVEQFEIEGKVRWRMRTAASKSSEGESGRRYISTTTKDTATSNSKSVSVSIRGDGEADSPSTYMIVKMQAKFKPRVQQNKEIKAKEKISRKELEQAVGRRLEDDEVKRLKRAKKDGTFYEEVLDVRVKGKHDKFAS